MQKYREAKAIWDKFEERIERERREKISRARSGETSPNSDGSENTRTDEEVAEVVGIGGRDTYRKLAKVMKAADKGVKLAKKLAVELHTDETTIHGASDALRDVSILTGLILGTIQNG